MFVRKFSLFQHVLLAVLRGEGVTKSGSVEEAEVGSCKAGLVHEEDTSLVYRAAQKFNKCGLVRLDQVLHADLLGEIFESYHNGTINKDVFRFGTIREKRMQMLVPFQYPFDLIAKHMFTSKSTPLLLAYAVLGPDMVLDFITIVSVPHNATKQDAHRDSPLEGTIAFHIPLLPIHQDFAPLTFCAETHLWTKEQSRKVYQAAPYEMMKGESVQSAVERGLCTDDRKVVGAPLAVGDLIVYDHRLYHWGMDNHFPAGIERLVLYVTFKANKDHPGVQPRSAEHGEEAVEARRQFEEEFQRNLDSLKSVFNAHEL